MRAPVDPIFAHRCRRRTTRAEEAKYISKRNHPEIAGGEVMPNLVVNVFLGVTGLFAADPRS